MLIWIQEGRSDMGRKHFKAEEIIQHLRTVEIEEAKGITLEESARKIGVSVQSIIRWRKEYGGLRLDQAKRLKELEAENARLKKIVANQALENSVLKEVASGNF
jgi:putative transposase